MENLTHASAEQNLRHWFFINAWFREDWDLSPDQWISSKNLSPFSSQWTYNLGSDWTFALFGLLDHKYSLS